MLSIFIAVRDVSFLWAQKKQQAASSNRSSMEGLQGMTPGQQQDFLQHLESQQVQLRGNEFALCIGGLVSAGYYCCLPPIAHTRLSMT